MSGSTRPARILVVEDEAHIAEGLRVNLSAEGYEVHIVSNGALALAKAVQISPDLMVLDVMLPQQDGFAVCQKARAQGFAAPILFLSARASVAERIEGLRLGGDDYLAKPFDLGEFLHRVQALLRRARRHAPAAVDVGGQNVSVLAPRGVRVDWVAGTVGLAPSGPDGAERIETVPPREMRVLQRLHQSLGEVVTREELLEYAWANEVWPSSRVLHACIERWRTRLEPDPTEPRWLLTEPGIGYCLRQEPT